VLELEKEKVHTFCVFCWYWLSACGVHHNLFPPNLLHTQELTEAKKAEAEKAALELEKEKKVFWELSVSWPGLCV